MTGKLTQFALICLCTLPPWFFLRRPWNRRIPREIALGMFVMYITALLVMALEGTWTSPADMLSTVKERLSTLEGIRLTPFETLQQQLNSIDTDDSRTQLLGNTLLFLPWGFFLPLLWQRFRGFFRMAGMCLALTCFIEFFQLFIGRTTDIDDVILNFSGGMVGAGMWRMCRRLIPAMDKLSE